MAVLKKNTCPASNWITGIQASNNKGRLITGSLIFSFKKIEAKANREKNA